MKQGGQLRTFFNPSPRKDSSLLDPSEEPVIFIAYANPPADPLRDVEKEAARLVEIFSTAEALDRCKLIEKRVSNVEDIVEVFTKHDDINIFHYAGHGDKDQIVLDIQKGSLQGVSTSGLTRLLTEPSVKLVFLNCCISQHHARELHQKGVPCTIATSRDVPDEVAYKLAERFYIGLIHGRPVKRSFDLATISETEYNRDFAEEQVKRGIQAGTEAPREINSLWQIYPENDNSIEDWIPFKKNNSSGKDGSSGKNDLVRPLLSVAISMLVLAVLAFTFLWWRNLNTSNEIPDTSKLEVGLPAEEVLSNSNGGQDVNVPEPLVAPSDASELEVPLPAEEVLSDSNGGQDVDVPEPSIEPPIINDFSSNQSRIIEGEQVRLSWNVTNADRCILTETGKSPTIVVCDSELVVEDLTVPTSFYLTAEMGNDVSVQKQLTIDVVERVVWRLNHEQCSPLPDNVGASITGRVRDGNISFVTNPAPARTDILIFCPIRLGLTEDESLSLKFDRAFFDWNTSSENGGGQYIYWIQEGDIRQQIADTPRRKAIATEPGNGTLEKASQTVFDDIPSNEIVGIVFHSRDSWVEVDSIRSEYFNVRLERN